MKYKKLIEGKYYINYDLDKKDEYLKKLNDLFDEYKDRTDIKMEYFFGEHSDYGLVIGFNINVVATNQTNAKAFLSEIKNIVKSRVGKLELLVEINKDLL